MQRIGRGLAYEPIWRGKMMGRAVRPVLDRVSCFSDLLLEDRDQAFAALRRAESTGRPVGMRSSSPGLNAFSDDGLHDGPQVPRQQPTSAPSS